MEREGQPEREGSGKKAEAGLKAVIPGGQSQGPCEIENLWDPKEDLFRREVLVILEGRGKIARWLRDLSSDPNSDFWLSCVTSGK